MPAFMLMLGGLLVRIAGYVVGKVLLSLGIGFVTFTGFLASVDWAKGLVVGALTDPNLPALSVQLMGVLNVGTVVSILFSAFATRLAVSTLGQGGQIWAMVQGPPQV